MSANVTLEQRDDVQFGQKILLAQVAFTLIRMDPDGAGQVLADELQLTPVFPAFCVSLIGRARAERDCETDDKTEDGQQQVADIQSPYELRDHSNRRGPEGNNDQGDDHLR